MAPPSNRESSRAAAKPPKYAALRDRLAEEILRGDIRRGDKLPSETALGRRFSVSRVTVRHALESLREAGLVESRQGQGHFARQVRISLEIERLRGFVETLRQQGIACTTEVLSTGEVAGRAQVRKALQLTSPQKVVQLVRLYRLGAAPVCLETRTIRPEIGKRLLTMDLARLEICRAYEAEFGIEIGHAEVSLDHVEAAATDARIMEIEKGAQLMRLRHLVFEGARPIEFCERLCLPSAFQITARAGRW